MTTEQHKEYLERYNIIEDSTREFFEYYDITDYVSLDSLKEAIKDSRGYNSSEYFEDVYNDALEIFNKEYLKLTEEEENEGLFSTFFWSDVEELEGNIISDIEDDIEAEKREDNLIFLDSMFLAYLENVDSTLESIEKYQSIRAGLKNV